MTNNNLRGILWVFSYSMLFTIGMTLNKTVNPQIPVLLKLFMRTLFGFLIFLPWFIHQGWSGFKTKVFRLHLLRIFCIASAMTGTYYAYTHLPFALAACIGFTGPIWTAILGILFLKDRLTLGQYAAIFLSYIGVLLIKRPDSAFQTGIFIALAANIFGGLSLIIGKKLTQHDSRATILMITNIGTLLTTTLSLLLFMVFNKLGGMQVNLSIYALEAKDVFFLICIGACGAFSQYSYITALKYASPSFLSPFEYTRLLFAVPVSLFLGEALPSSLEWFGMFIIAASTGYITWVGSRTS